MHRYLEVLIESVCDHRLYIKTSIQAQDMLLMWHAWQLWILHFPIEPTLLADHRATQNERTAHFIIKWEDKFLYLYWPKSIQNTRCASAVKIKQLYVCLFLLISPCNQSQSTYLEPREYHGHWLSARPPEAPQIKWMLPLQHSSSVGKLTWVATLHSMVYPHKRHSQALLFVACIHQDQKDVHERDQS